MFGHPNYVLKFKACEMQISSAATLWWAPHRIVILQFCSRTGQSGLARTMRFFQKNDGSWVQAWQQKIWEAESTQVRPHFHTGNASSLSLLISHPKVHRDACKSGNRFYCIAYKEHCQLWGVASWPLMAALQESCLHTAPPWGMQCAGTCVGTYPSFPDSCSLSAILK